LRSIVQQQGGNYEIVICDDGSAKKDFSFLPAFFEKYGIQNYKIVENEVNQGTVRNCLSGVMAASGEYVFLTSPGDLLFDDSVIRDFYQFAQKNKVEMCFGNAIYYRDENGIAKQTRTVGKPEIPQIYGLKVPLSIAKASYANGNWVIGASYFRKREMALKYFAEIAETSVYMEDTTSTAFALVDGIRLWYYDRNMIWYEDGAGVSTTGDQKWRTILQKDLTKSLEKLKMLHVGDAYADVMYQNCCIQNAYKRIIYKWCHHPGIMSLVMLGRLTMRRRKLSCSPADLERLESQLYDR
jgi:glycosyltransferase involved in cell wall biosynthesis